LRAHLRLAATSAMRNAGKVVHEAYSTAGSDAIFDDHPLHQCFQDIHALTQQIQARQAHYRTVGRTLLGLEPDAPMV
ncbi:MAG: acyl-CoA dehydrogenase, partial [Chromatiales bacterium]|nr:acyl-CoA dehydrogenase [Chromatiales bacterium]